MTLNILRLESPPPIFLEFIINWRTPSQKFIEKTSIEYIFIKFTQILDYVFIILTCTLLAYSSRICRLFLKFCLSTSITWLCRSMCFWNVYDFFLQSYMLLNQFHLNLSWVMKLWTWLCLRPVTTKYCNIMCAKYQADIHIDGIDGCDIILAGCPIPAHILLSIPGFNTIKEKC